MEHVQRYPSLLRWCRLYGRYSSCVRHVRESLSGAQVELIEQPFTCITCSSILLVNLERIGFNLRNFDMTIVFKVRHHRPFR